MLLARKCGKFYKEDRKYISVREKSVKLKMKLAGYPERGNHKTFSPMYNDYFD